MNHDRDHVERSNANTCDLPMSRSTVSVLNPRDWAVSKRREMSAGGERSLVLPRHFSRLRDRPSPRMTLYADLDVQSAKRDSSDLSATCKKVASRHAITPVTETSPQVQLLEKLDLTRGKISIIAKPMLPEVLGSIADTHTAGS